jgi:hypothetical protein
MMKLIPDWGRRPGKMKRHVRHVNAADPHHLATIIPDGPESGNTYLRVISPALNLLLIQP